MYEYLFHPTIYIYIYMEVKKMDCKPTICKEKLKTK